MSTARRHAWWIVMVATVTLVSADREAFAVVFPAGHAFAAPDREVSPYNSELYEFSSTTSFGSPTVRYFDAPGLDRGIGVSPSSRWVFAIHLERNITDTGWDTQLYRFGADGSQTKWTFGQGTLAGATLPANRIAFAPNGNLLVVNTWTTGGIMEITPSGQYVRTIGTGGKPLWGAVWAPGTNYIYGVDGEIGSSRNKMHKIDTTTGSVVASYTVKTNMADIAYIDGVTDKLAIRCFYNSGSSTALYNLSGTLLGSSAGPGITDDSWGRAFAYDPTTAHLIGSEPSMPYVRHMDVNTLVRVNAYDSSMPSPAAGGGWGGYWDVAVVGEYSYAPEPATVLLMALGAFAFGRRRLPQA